MVESDNDDLPPAPKNRKPPVISARCGSCMFHKEAATYKAPCAQLGVGINGRICGRFLPNVYRMLDSSIVKTVMGLDENQLRMISGLAHQELQTRRTHNVHWGTVGYFHFGGDYLSNYRKALVLAATEQHYYLMSESKDGKIRATILKENFYDEKRWKRKQLLLRKKGLLIDPEYKKYFASSKPRITLKYEPPTIDDLARANKAAVRIGKDSGSIVSVRGARKK